MNDASPISKPAKPALEEPPGDPEAQLQGSRPLVSIIIPTYNYAHYLAEAVDSALAQTWRPIEIIIVDDGSTDDTRESVRGRFAEEPLVRYLYQQNQGLSAARNTGIKNASGEWLVFLDADDRLLPPMLETTMKTAASLPKDFALVASHAALIDAGGSRLPERFIFAPGDKEISRVDLLVMNRFGCTVLGRREAFLTCGLFDTDLKASEDRDMWIRISLRHRIHRLGETLFEIRRHDSNMSGNGARQAAAMRQVLAKAYRSGALTGWRRLYWCKIKSHFLYQQALLESRNGIVTAIARILASLILWPWFSDWRELGQKKPWFRIRTMAWLIRERSEPSIGKPDKSVTK